jgi:D-glycero-alpha-D-manno-heptose-7-phosphate kinase
MIVHSSAPLRIGLFGGGTDVGEFVEKEGGVVVNMAINIRQNFMLSSESPGRLTDSFVEEVLDNLNLSDWYVDQSFDFRFVGSGLGSSASAVVALVGAANKIHNWGLSKDQIAQKAWDIEVNKLKMFGGKQDQYAAVYGGVSIFYFSKDGVGRTPINHEHDIFSNILIFHTGIDRTDHDIQEGLMQLAPDQLNHLLMVKQKAIDGATAILEDDVDRMARLLRESWEHKKLSNKGVSNKQIDTIINKGKELGAIGWKLNGSGGGGTVLFVVKPKKQANFIKKIGLKQIDFEIDYQGVSTRIL